MLKLDEELIKKLSDLLKDNNLSEIELKDGNKSIKVVQELTGSGLANNMQYDNYSNRSNHDEKKEETLGDIYAKHEGALRAPMVGTLFHSSSPDAKPYVQEGSEVDVGDTLFIIEAMKTMNQVKSDKKGKIKKVLVKNAEPVEFDDIIAIIE